ncbi:MAG TPA: head GIN domain-containing protein [Croceibacterium sp.]
MRLDELFRNLGQIAGTIGVQMREACEGVPLEELDLTGPPPRQVALCGPARVVLSEGEVFRIDVEAGPASDEVRFALGEERLRIAGGNGDTVVRVTLPAPGKLSVAGSGRMTAEKLAPDGEVSIAGSGRLELASVEGGKLAVSIAGSGRLFADGRADEFALSIAGSGSCDAEGLTVDKAAVHIAGSGDAIFACNGEVAAHLMGSGNVIVRGSARCSVHSVGSGTVTCEREREAAD